MSQTRQNIRSPTSSTFPHPLSNASTLSRSASTSSRPRHPPPVAINSNLTIPGASGLPDSPHSPVVDSPRHTSEYQHQQQALHPQDGAGHGHPTEVSINGVPTPTTPTVQMLVPPDSAAAANGAPVSLSATSSSTTLVPPSSARSTVSTPDSASQSTLARSPSTARSKDGPGGASGSGNTPDNPYRSFRVTLEDPCYKVLPAALKKYKINDDWRLYALFICYGNTERCLAYDEKPLILFQKLKESNDNPVFMLRHIKDIKSPIAVASAKHAARRDKRPPGIGGGVERSLMGVNRDGSAAPSATTTTPANGLGPNARPTRLHHPPVLLPVGKDKAAEEAGDGSGADQKDEKERRNQGYCIAIYPYLAERECVPQLLPQSFPCITNFVCHAGTNSTWQLVTVSLAPSLPLCGPDSLARSLRHPLEDKGLVGRPSRPPVDQSLVVDFVESRSLANPAQVGMGSGGMPARDLDPSTLSPRHSDELGRRHESLNIQVLAGRPGARRQRSVGPDPALVRRVSLDSRRRLDGLHASRARRARRQERPALADPQAVQPLELRDQGGRRTRLVAELVLRQGQQA